jgi:hypothetical protein
MPKERCAFETCKRTLALTSIACKCEKKFCGAHRHAELHFCAFDYQASAKEHLMKTMSKPIVAEKLSIL